MYFFQLSSKTLNVNQVTQHIILFTAHKNVLSSTWELSISILKVCQLQNIGYSMRKIYKMHMHIGFNRRRLLAIDRRLLCLLYPVAYLAHRSYQTFPRNVQSLSFLKVKQPFLLNQPRILFPKPLNDSHFVKKKPCGLFTNSSKSRRLAVIRSKLTTVSSRKFPVTVVM